MVITAILTTITLTIGVAGFVWQIRSDVALMSATMGQRIGRLEKEFEALKRSREDAKLAPLVSALQISIRSLEKEDEENDDWIRDIEERVRTLEKRR